MREILTKAIFQLFNPCISKHVENHRKESYEDPTFFTKVLIHISFYILQFLGYLNEALFPYKRIKEAHRNGYLPLYDKFLTFYLRHVIHRVIDCWFYPVCSAAGGVMTLRNRIKIGYGPAFQYTGLTTKCLNLASYNYLGFAKATGSCAEEAIKSIYAYGLSTGNTRRRNGTCKLHDDLEKLLRDFLEVEDCIVFGMGFATNSLNIPRLLNTECLVISDEKNHASLIVGIKLSGAVVTVFKHNDMKHLEQILREAIYFGQPHQDNNNFKPWKKIVIFVEGIYSMDGTICNLPEIIVLKKKYKAYLYLDEAHSIGALGKCGKGVVDYYKCNSKDIDVWMGTFTKSFGSMGGFIAGRKDLIIFLREHSLASNYAWAMAPPLAAKALASLKILMGRDGTDEGQRRMNRLAKNTRYFRGRLQQMGLIVYGHDDSPVVPILVYFFSKIAYLTRALLKENIAVIGVGYPATSITEVRIRICLSSDHTKEQLDYALKVMDRLSDEAGLRYSRQPRSLTPVNYDNIKTYHDL